MFSIGYHEENNLLTLIGQYGTLCLTIILMFSREFLFWDCSVPYYLSLPIYTLYRHVLVMPTWKPHGYQMVEILNSHLFNIINHRQYFLSISNYQFN